MPRKRPFRFKPEKLTRLREKAKLSKAELGRRILALETDPPPGRGESLRTCVSRWENGHHPPKATAVFALAKVLGVDPRALYG